LKIKFIKYVHMIECLESQRPQAKMKESTRIIGFNAETGGIGLQAWYGQPSMAKNNCSKSKCEDLIKPKTIGLQDLIAAACGKQWKRNIDDKVKGHLQSATRLNAKLFGNGLGGMFFINRVGGLGIRGWGETILIITLIPNS
jgi:hypothetical protein